MRYQDKQDFVGAYKEAILFADSEEGVEYCIDDLSDEAEGVIIADCRYFCENYNHLIEEKGYSQAGHDFWMTRQGHGCGFWDGDWPQRGEVLTEAAKKFAHLDLYEGDDGKLYFT
jgi:hypothetical protein